MASKAFHRQACTPDNRLVLNSGINSFQKYLFKAYHHSSAPHTTILYEGETFNEPRLNKSDLYSPASDKLNLPAHKTSPLLEKREHYTLGFISSFYFCKSSIKQDISTTNLNKSTMDYYFGLSFYIIYIKHPQVNHD